jgi:hypothetical protein
MTAVIASPFAPVSGTGRAQRTLAIVQALARLEPVRFLYTPFEGGGPDGAFAAIAGVTYESVETSRGVRRAVAYARGRVGGVPQGLARGVSPPLAAAAAHAAREPGVRLVADGPVAAAALVRTARRRGFVYNAHNLESAFRGGRAMARFERAVMAAATQTWMVSHADVTGARTLAPGADVHYVPNAINVRAIEPITPRVDARRVLFLADHRYPPNHEARDHLESQVMPFVWAREPEAVLVLAGRGLEGRPAAGVEHAGFVDDLAALYASAATVAVPLLSGGGSPLKFVEALAFGLPVVATPHAARGLVAQAGRDYLEAQGAEPFAAALVSALRGDAGDVARAGRRLAEAEYSIEALASRLEACR